MCSLQPIDQSVNGHNLKSQRQSYARDILALLQESRYAGIPLPSEWIVLRVWGKRQFSRPWRNTFDVTMYLARREAAQYGLKIVNEPGGYKLVAEQEQAA